MIRKTHYIKFSFLTVVLLFLHIFVFGQSTENSFPFSVSVHNTKKGLPQNQVLDIIEYKNEIFVSTINGIASYNGIRFTPISVDGNYNTIFYNLFSHERSQELFGLKDNGEYCQILPRYKKLYYYACVQFDNKTLVGINRDGLIHASDLSMKNVSSSIQTNIKNAIAIILYGDYYFVADSQNLYKVHKNTGVTHLFLTGYFGTLKINPYTNELLVINGDIYYIDVNYRVRQITPLIHTPTTKVIFRDISFLDKNEILIASSHGLYHIKNNNRFFYDTKDGITSGSLYKLYKHPSENSILVGTENNGLMILSRNKANTYYTFSKTNLSQSFTSIVQDNSGSVYSTASKGDIIKIDKNGKETTYLSIDKHVASIAWINNRLYVGTFGEGLFIYQDKTPKGSISSSLLPSLHIHVIYKDNESNIWIGTYRGISKQNADGEIKKILETDGNIVSVYELRNGNICFGGGDGFFIITKDGKKLSHIGKNQGLKGKEVRCFYEDERGCLWIGTYGGGLYAYEKNRLVSINNKPNCALNKDVFTLAKSDNGNFYMSSNEGIWSVSERKLRDFYTGKLHYLIPEYYGEEVGIKNTEFNGGFCNNYLEQGNKMWFPSINGLVEFNIDKNLSHRKIVPKFKSVIVNDTVFPKSQNFGKDIHTVQFDFYCSSFSEQRNIYYQYKLIEKNSSESWSPLQKSRQVIFKMLPPGEYTFYVRAIDCSNDVNPQELSYHFIITPYFYEKTIFYVVLTIVFLGLIYFVTRYQIKRVKRWSKMNRLLVELKLKAIQSKMNPHFMFNSLNNIIYLLTIGKHKEAERLLEDFSLLLRRFIEKSDDFFISLDEELEMIKLYLSIQQKRYNHLFDYQIITKELDEGVYEIPSMLIQPFVENAIIHGIAHSKKHCKLEISIKNVNNILEICIEDDGIGREKSMEINNKYRQEHTSYGTQLIEDKIKIMRKKYGLNISFKIIDINEENRSGTTVQINIPIHHDTLRNY